MPPFPPCCGLIIVGSRRPIPLQRISVDVQVKGFVADVSATLKYKNKEEKAIEAVFVFPMDEDSAVYSFEATIEGKKIVADLQEKKQAQKTYNEAIRKGKQAFLLQEDESSADIFSCSVGNLPPGQDAEISIKYVLELPMEADGAVRFVLPAVLNPRYTPEDHDLSITATRPVLPIGKISYTLSLTTHFHSAYGIAKIESNCDITPLEYTDSDKTSAKVSLAEGYKFEQDVELLAYYMDVNKPSVTVEAGLGCTDAVQEDKGSTMAGPVAMLNFYPSFPAGQEQSSRGEFIFLVDRSGSMGWIKNSEPNPPRIESAKETLVILLKSLPLGCYFNIFGFGSHFEAFFPESVEYTQQSMEEAVKKVNEMDASFGGTEILKPLKKIYDTAGRAEHPRQLFVFTDGEVGNTKKVIKVVQKNAREHRCFTFGIGEGASTSLIKGMARAGGGTFEFITGKDRMQPKVLRALKCSLQPAVMDISLTWTLPSGVEAIVLSKVPTTIFQGQRSIVYAQLKGKNEENEAEGEVCLQYKFQGEIVKNNLHFHLNVQNAERPTIYRLAAKALISELEHGTEAKSEKVKKMILETSLQSGVVSSLTAFVAVNKDTKTRVTGPPVRREVSAPSILQNSGMIRMMPQNAGISHFLWMAQGGGEPMVKSGHQQSEASDVDEDFEDDYEDPSASDEDCDYAAYEDMSASDSDNDSEPNCDCCAYEDMSVPPLIYQQTSHECRDIQAARSPCKGPPATRSPFKGPTVPPRTYLQTSHECIDIQAASPSYGLYKAPTAASSSYGPCKGPPVPPRRYVPISHGCIDIQEKQSGHTSQAKTSQALVRLIALQNADGSWNLTPEVLEVLGISEADMKAGNPDQNMEVSMWVTVLAVIWLHTTSLDQREEWELLEKKAISWVRAKGGSSLGGLVRAGNNLLKSSLDPKVFGL